MDHPKELTHISLCAGYGGIDLGLRGALGAVRTVAFSEIEAFPCENLVTKIEAGLLDLAPIWTDLKTFPWSSFRGAVDILSGGFPCQPFSSAGQRRGDDDPRHLWPHIVRGIRELGHPPIVFFENVEGIISSKLTGTEWSDPAGTPVLLHVLRELERLGYSATAGVFSAREIGLPHQRKRVFILGARHDLTHDQREWVSSLLRARGHNVENACAERAPSAREPRAPCAYGSEREGELETEYASSSLDDTRDESLGDSEYNGHPPPSLRGSDAPPLNHRSSCGEDIERELEGAGSPLQWADVADANDPRDTPRRPGAHFDGAQSSEERRRLPLAEPCRRGHARTAPPAPRGADVAHAHDSREEPNRFYVDGHGAQSSEERRRLPLAETRTRSRVRTASPAPRGADQYGWEPPRVTGDSVEHTSGIRSERVEPRLLPTQTGEGEADRHTRADHITGAGVQRQTEPSMGRDTDGTPCRVDYEELCHSVDNRTDELRLLGNGVVPATSERAFRVLWARVGKTT